MELSKSGLVLFTENYQSCVLFYQKTLGLPVLFVNEELTCFEFGGSYLMLEREGFARTGPKTPAENPVCLRFNVADVKREAAKLKELGIGVDYQEYSWGAVAKFCDPDGNVCALRDSISFDRQITRNG